MNEYRGIPVSAGVTIARAFVVDDAHTHLPKRLVSESMVEAEQARFEGALESARADLTQLRAEAEADLGRDAANIFAFHLGMLSDKSLIDPIRSRIADERVTAEFAVQEEMSQLADRFARMNAAAFQTKVDDVWDIEMRLVKHLIGAHNEELAKLDHDAVVIAPDLTPSMAAAFPREHLKGFAIGTGGPTSHMAIFARALEIPAVMGLRWIADGVREGDPVIIDGDRGLVIVRPDEETLERYRGYVRAAELVASALSELVDVPAETTDGTLIELMGNIEFAEETGAVLRYGGDGVGLFRTEFLWLTSTHEPTEEEQYEQYRDALRGADGRPVTIRTFDLGADKQTQERASHPERNPFLGLRSIRYCLQNLGMFRKQLRAILRASAEGRVKIMFPLVTNMSELRQAKMIVRDVMEELAERNVPFDRDVPLGMMVETPSAAVLAASFAKEVDFFSIGTNDLIQYTLAVDRTNERVANLYNPAHPAVIRLLKDITRAARHRQIEVSICGEMAGDVEYTMLLLGLGLRTLSATPARIPFLKRVVRSVSIEQCERLARTAGSFDSERRVASYLRSNAVKNFPELFDARADDV